MSNKRTILGLPLRWRRKLARFAAIASLLIVLPVAGFAQETTTRVRGVVLAPDGSPAPGASVTITDTRTGAQRNVATSTTGGFAFRGLPVGGPYTIRVVTEQYEDTLITDVMTSLSEEADFTIRLDEQSDVEEIVVTAAAVRQADLALGPGSSFGIQELETMPSIARQVRDIIRIDPRVSIGRNENGAGSGVYCLGGHPRSNAFTIDGTLASDGFGLNEGTGTSARFAFPIPFDTVASAAVEFAPIDVQYSQFTGCAINVVTKPGANEFSGSAFYLYNDDSLTGDKLQGDTVITDPFEDTNWGFDVSGPIIKDKLFFSLAYEETDEGGVQNIGPIGGGFATEDFLTVTDANQIADILRNQYDRDPGDIVRTLPQTSERWFARFDWNVNDNHRAEFTYTSLEELNMDPDDLGFDGFTFSDNFELEGIDQESFSVRVFSDWTDTFSTEFRYSDLDVTDIQGPVGGGEAQDANPITRITVEDGAGDAILTSGPGTFRSANDLQYSEQQLKLAANWVWGINTFTFGFEQANRDVFNLFIPNATGTIVFPDVNALQAGLASEISFSGSFTTNPVDAAAAFERTINSFYVQDEIQLSDTLKLVAGLRFDEYTSDDLPIANPVFEQRYGLTNTQTFDGLELLQPRIGITWDVPSDRFGSTQIRAGFGVFGGGDPTVHFANSYQNFGGAIGNGDDGDCTAADLQVTDSSGQFTGLPDCVVQAAATSANANTGPVAAVDPNFDLPSNERWNFGVNHITSFGNDFFDNWEIQFDYIYTKHKNAVDWIDLTLTQNVDASGALIFLPDGRPQFNAIDPLLPGCNATFNGIGQGFSNVTTECDSGGDDQDILMTNGVEGKTESISIQFGKEFELGDRTSLDLRFGYAYTDAEVGNPVNSSTATSSFEEVAVAVINDVRLGPAHWASKHNFVLRARFQHYFFDENPTTIAMFFTRKSGQPFSYVYDNNTPTIVFGDSDNEERNLLYVPTGPNDPLVDFSGLDADGTTDAFFEFLDSSGLSAYAGGIAPKNGFNEPYWNDLDIRISQAFPMPWLEHSLEVFLDIENVLNLFSDSNNIRRYRDAGDVMEGVPVLDALLSSDGTQFVYDNFNPGGGNSEDNNFNPINRRDVDDSVYRIQLGVRYRF
jgi:hypothetical protein